MNILYDGEASLIRSVFIESFVNTESNYYKSKIQRRKKVSDGYCYTGYLWDCVSSRQRISYQQAIQFLQDIERSMYAFWDIHSEDLILKKHYWIYPKESILVLSKSEIAGMIPTLPEDCYFFDDTLSWAIALTHEEIKAGKRICYSVNI